MSTKTECTPLNLLFIHHSCGGHWLADKGKESCVNCICATHPNGGGLRKLLEKNNYVVHEASYKSIIGDKTDILDWLPKFQKQMDRILRTKMQDELLPEGETNQIIMFKSCFPNNNFPDDDSVQKAQNAYKSLLPIFEKNPAILFKKICAISEPGGSSGRPLTWVMQLAILPNMPRCLPADRQVRHLKYREYACVPSALHLSAVLRTGRSAAPREHLQNGGLH